MVKKKALNYIHVCTKLLWNSERDALVSDIGGHELNGRNMNISTPEEKFKNIFH